MTFTMGSNNDIGLAEVTALLAALGIAIYVLGLVALCWPIYRKITNDASTALYAVSLMPKTMVAGQGVRVLFGLPSIMAVVLTPLVIVQTTITRAIGQVVHSAWVFLAVDAVIVVIVLGIFFFLLSRMTTLLEAFEVGGGSRWGRLLIAGTGLVGGHWVRPS